MEVAIPTISFKNSVDSEKNLIYIIFRSFGFSFMFQSLDLDNKEVSIKLFKFIK